MSDLELSNRVDVAIRARMARHVLPRPPSEIDARTGFVLKIANVLKIDLPNRMPERLLAVLSDPAHADRISTATDPGLVIRITDSEHEFAEIEKILLNPDVRVRLAVLDELERKVSASSDFCCNSTKRIIAEADPAARSELPAEYLRACLQIHDALRFDIPYNLALLRQVGASGDVQSAMEYVNRLMRPPQHGLSCFEEQPLIRALAAGTALDDALIRAKEQSDVGSMLTEYFALCGFLPLTGTYSCGSVLQAWKTLHQGIGISWKEIADWATRNGSVLAQYQICQAVIDNQEIIDDDSSPDINERICEIVQAGVTEDVSAAWNLRQRLARYYCQYLTCEFAGGDTERMAVCAWWLADKLATALEQGIAHCREHCIQHINEILEANEELWLMVQPGGGPSVLFSASMQHRRVWAESLTAEIANSIVETGSTKLLPLTIHNMTRTALGGALFSHSGIQKTDELNYSFEIDVVPFINELINALEGKQPTENLRRIVSIPEKLRLLNEFNESIKALPTLDDELARVTVFALQQSAFAGGAPVELVWECLSDAVWRRTLVHAESEQAFTRFCETAIRIQATAQSEEWRIRLPHIFAIAALQDDGTEERRAALVSYCVVSSIAGGCTSAIERLIASEHEEIRTTLRHWHSRLGQIIRFARPLAAARLRPIKQSLSAGLRLKPISS